MDNETLTKANRIQSEISCMEKMMYVIEKNSAVEITFCNGGYCCCSNQSDYLSDDEVAAIKTNITEQIRIRVQARLHELQKEFDNL